MTTLIAEQIIGFCAGDASGEDLDDVRDFLRTTGATEKDVARMLLAMRGMHTPDADASLREVSQHAMNPIPRGRQCTDEGCDHYGTPHECLPVVSAPVTDLAVIDAARGKFSALVNQGLDEFTRATGLLVTDLHADLRSDTVKDRETKVRSNVMTGFSVSVIVPLAHGKVHMKV